MANYGYAGNAPSYGYQTVQKKQPVSPYYRAATMQAGGAAAPFDTLASGTGAAPATKPAVTQQGNVDAAGHPIAAPASIQKPGDIPAGSTESTPYQTGTQSSTAGVAYDPSADPVLQQILATGVTSRQGAEAGALAAKKQLALQYGDVSLANQIGDTATAQAAGANPYAVFPQLKKNYDQTAQQADQTYNANNLFYSGAREVGQGQLADQYGANVAQQTATEQQALGGIEQNRLAQILGADQADNQAKNDATSRAIQIAADNGWSFGGWDSSGNPIFTQPGSSSGGAATTTTTPDTSGGQTFVNTGGAGGSSGNNAQIVTSNNVPAGLSSALAAALGTGSGGLTTAKQKQLLSLFG